MNKPQFDKIDASRKISSSMNFDRPNTEIPDYRTVSKSAVVCVVFAVMGLLAFTFPMFVILPLLSICFGVSALINCKRFPDELTGQAVTRIALATSVVVLVSAVSMHAVEYATEVPEGHQRISFFELKPDKRTPTAFSKRAGELDGERVFLKGYVRPGLQQKRLKKFILVGDFGSCCFGGNPEITDVVAVTLKNEDDFVNYGFQVKKIAGEFKLHQRPKSVSEKDLPYVLYEIEADHIK